MAVSPFGVCVQALVLVCHNHSAHHQPHPLNEGKIISGRLPAPFVAASWPADLVQWREIACLKLHILQFMTVWHHGLNKSPFVSPRMPYAD